MENEIYKINIWDHKTNGWDRLDVQSLYYGGDVCFGRERYAVTIYE